MPSMRRSPGPRRLIALFLAVLVPPAGALVWLGARVADQGRRLLTESERRQREAAAEGAALALTEGLQLARTSLDAGRPLPGSAQLRQSASGAAALEPADAFAWTPSPVTLPEAEAQLFAQAELEEIRRSGDRGRTHYEAFADAPDGRIRAGALLRLARVFRAEHRPDDVIRTYARLAGITGVAFEGIPGDLLARRATCGVYEQVQRLSDLAACATTLERDLIAGRWSLDFGAWNLAAEQIHRWLNRPIHISDDRRAMSAAADSIWRETRRPSASALPASSYRTVVTDHGVTTVAWTTSADGLVATLIAPGLLNRWLEAESARVRQSGLQLTLFDTDRRPIGGDAPPRSPLVTTRDASITGLPWHIVISRTDPGSVPGSAMAGRWTLTAGLVVIVLFIAGGGLLMWRVMQRELAVARLQTEFVSAVSHEFRTPLTSLQHVADLLDEDDVLPPERRTALYRVIGRSTARLSGLVESLLDFARMEGGRRPYELQPHDAARLVSTTVGEFRQQLEAGEVAIAVDSGPGDLTIRADESALGRAVWNLLENAVKYSDPPCVIDVAVSRRGASIAIAVRDRGRGIPRHEQRDVFRKFVRGADAVGRRVPGTGLGLAIVSHIVQAHGGVIELESTQGVGSTFTITVPAMLGAEATMPVGDQADVNPIQRGGVTS
jgi:two-component system phosphate regulon sensor histidine kinase PhoR